MSIQVPKVPTLRTWRETKVPGKTWGAAMAGPDPYGYVKSMRDARGRDWWKRYGLRGYGATRAEAIADLESWKVASDFVAEIY